MDASDSTTYNFSCPSCGGQRIAKFDRPVQSSPAPYVAICAAIGLSFIRWPVTDWRNGAVFIIGIALIYFIAEGWVKHRHRQVLALTPERWRCEDCDILGNHDHFYRRIKEKAAAN